MRKAILIFLMSLIGILAMSIIIDFTDSPPTLVDSKEFVKGYKDGWENKWTGAIYWTLSRDYRQGHMIGTYDKQNNKEKEH